MCGFIKQSVQLLITAVVFIIRLANFPPKKNSVSLAADSLESLPWTAFLVPSVPKTALRDYGFSALAVSEFVGPMKSLHPAIAPLEASSIPMHTSDVTNSSSLG